VLDKTLMMAGGMYEALQRVGPAAYPHLTGQVACDELFSMKDLEEDRHCMQDDFEVVPNMVFKGQMPDFIPDRWASAEAAVEYLDPAWVKGSSFQLFVGGTDSGAAMHFHNWAYNVMFFGCAHVLVVS